MSKRETFEAAAKVRLLDLSRDPEWVPISGEPESERPYYNGRTSAAWWAWQESQAAERERWKAHADALRLFVSAGYGNSANIETLCKAHIQACEALAALDGRVLVSG